MNKQLSLKNAIISSFKNTTLNAGNIKTAVEDPNRGISWDWLDFGKGDTEGTRSVTIEVRVSGDKFDFQDGDLKVTQAVVDFELSLSNCPYNTKTKQITWADNVGFSSCATEYRANVDTYNNDEWLTAGRDTIYQVADGLIDSQDIDEDFNISNNVGTMLIENTDKEPLIEFFKALLASQKPCGWNNTLYGEKEMENPRYNITIDVMDSDLLSLLNEYGIDDAVMTCDTNDLKDKEQLCKSLTANYQEDYELPDSAIAQVADAIIHSAIDMYKLEENRFVITGSNDAVLRVVDWHTGITAVELNNEMSKLSETEAFAFTYYGDMAAIEVI